MDSFIWCIIAVMLVTNLTFIDYGGKQASTLQDKYKKAVDAGTDAAAKHISYTTETQIEELGYGFGEGFQHTNNVNISKEDSLKWFYEVFFGNVGCINDTARQQVLKKYIPMKAIVGFDKIFIADANDNWVVEKEYIINVGGVNRKFTLSDQVFYNGEWKTDEQWGISKNTRINLVNEFISKTLNDFINANKTNTEDTYNLKVGTDVTDYKFSLIEGTNFIVFIEGMPLPTFDLAKGSNKFYSFSMGGAELKRKK